MPDIPETEKAYAAGFFDGEGTVIINYSQDTPYVRVSIGQDDRRPLERIQALFGGSIYKAGGNQHHWETGRRDTVILFLESIQPYVSRRKKKIEVALEVVRLIKNGTSNQFGDQRNQLMRWKLAGMFEELSNE